MRVLICGGRDITKAQREFIYEWLSWFDLNYVQPDKLILINGKARGVDSVASEWAMDNYAGVTLIEYPANWQQHGKAAGYIRNKQMLEEGKPDLVIAFPGGKGTAMMVKIAKEAGVPVEVVEYIA